jgi:hypothetical protein
MIHQADATLSPDWPIDLEMIRHCLYEISPPFALYACAAVRLSRSKEYLSLGDFDMGRSKA